MEVNEAESENVERLCQAVSPNDEPCDFPATVHCRSRRSGHYSLLDLCDFSARLTAECFCCCTNTVQFVLQLTQFFFELSFFTFDCR
jgi:hypothetical protein